MPDDDGNDGSGDVQVFHPNSGAPAKATAPGWMHMHMHISTQQAKRAEVYGETGSLA